MNHFTHFPPALAVVLSLALISGCAKKEAAIARDIGPEAAAYY